MRFANQLSHPALRAELVRPPRPRLVAHHVAFVGASGPATPPRSFAASLRWIFAIILEGFAATGEAMYPSFAPPRELDLRRSEASDAPAQEGELPLRRFWSAMRRNRQDRRLSDAWEVLDDRTLRDIGVSRYEIESFARLRPARRDDERR